MDLINSVLSGDRLALARLLTRVENEDPAGLKALAKLYPHTGGAYRLGITGPPGTGKSTLVNQLALLFRRGLPQEGEKAACAPCTVGIVAVDPSSPFSGGAFLGDRIRMRDLSGDAGIFIRSMATRGALGGLARATADLLSVLDAAGFEMLLIETVGAGQAEVDIARMAHTTIVVDAPGLGDDVQAVKAGLLEIADIVVVNKADLPSAQNTLRALRAALALSPPKQLTPPGGKNNARQTADHTWQVPVLSTVATQGEGIQELTRAVLRHRELLGVSGEMAAKELERLKSEMQTLLGAHLLERFLHEAGEKEFSAALHRVVARKISPRQAVVDLVKKHSG
jgi:LAO/AO transport system kinase